MQVFRHISPLVALVTLSLAVTPQPFAQGADSTSARTWLGQEDAIEQYIIEADVVSIEELGTGVTTPKVADLEPGGPVARISFKPIRPGRYRGYWESYLSEVAAYELDKLLQLGMTPPTVEKQIGRETGAAALWVSPIQSFNELGGTPSPPSTRIGWWNYQLIRAKMFHNLINNEDPNSGNWLVDPAWNIILIDNSRAFTAGSEMVHELTRVDRELWDRMLALDETVLESAVGEWLNGGEIRGILRNRDLMAESIDRMIEERGEQDVFVRYAAAPSPDAAR